MALLTKPLIFLNSRKDGRQKDRKTERRKTERQKEGKTERQKDGNSEIQKDTKTQRRKDTKTEFFVRCIRTYIFNKPGFIILFIMTLKI